MAALSPALLTEEELDTAVRVAMANLEVQQKLEAGGRSAKLLVYVLPVEWRIADLPTELLPRAPFGHHEPAGFDRRLYKVLFARAKTYAATATGRDILRTAYGREPILLVHVNNETEQVTGIESAPAQNPRWGDIPTPLF